MSKKISLLILFICLFNISQSQEWMTSFDAAKRIGIAQNKLLLVVWEHTSFDHISTIMLDKERLIVVRGKDFLYDEKVSEFLWNYFVPVKLPEDDYEVLFSEIEGKQGYNYINKFNDDSIKIMDANGFILNSNGQYEDYVLFYKFIERYAVKTSLLEQDLRNYLKQESFLTAYALASKYLDFTLFLERKNWKEYVKLSDVYLNEALSYLPQKDANKQSSYQQKCELLKVKQYVMQNSPRKAIRFLKKYEVSNIFDLNKSMYHFLLYTSYMMINKEEEALLWRDGISLVDLKKSKIIIDNF